MRYGDGAAPELKRRMTTGGYDFIKRSSVNYPAVQRNNAGVTTYTPAACIVELNVNTFTGEIEIMRHHSLVDSGQMIVPELVSGQLQGGLAMGIGHALMEELPLYEDGPGNGTWNFNRYTLPRAKNVAVWNQTADYLAPLSENLTDQRAGGGGDGADHRRNRQRHHPCYRQALLSAPRDAGKDKKGSGVVNAH